MALPRGFVQKSKLMAWGAALGWAAWQSGSMIRAGQSQGFLLAAGIAWVWWITAAPGRRRTDPDKPWQKYD